MLLDYIVEINFKKEFLKSTMKPRFSRDIAETGKITIENWRLQKVLLKKKACPLNKNIIKR